MNDLVRQITSYKIFNYLLPGAIFCWVLDAYFGYPLVPEDLFVAFFVFYVVGLSISRVGSIAIEPIIAKMGIIPRRPYADYVKASKDEPFIAELSEANNVYRTLISLPLCIAGYHLVVLIADCVAIPVEIRIYFLIIFVAGLFLLAHRKQSEFICKRIDLHEPDRSKGQSEAK